MKKLILIIALMLATVRINFAQEAGAPVSRYLLDSLHPAAIAKPLPDSMRQVVRKLFKWGRLYGTAGAISGGMMVASATFYIANRKDDWGAGVDLFLGANALAFGTTSMIRFSRTRERQVLADLEKGQPLRPDVATWMPLVSRDGQRKKAGR